MSRIISGSFGLIAATLAFNAVQLEIASGSDASPLLQRSEVIASGPTSDAINRDAKGDRGYVVTKPVDSMTFSFQLPDARDISVAMRIQTGGKPAPRAAQKLPSDNEKSDASKLPRKANFACDAVASPLAANAKLLQPGRCMT